MLVFFIILSIFNFFIDRNINLIKEFVNDRTIGRNIFFKENKFNNQDISKYEIEELHKM